MPWIFGSYIPIKDSQKYPAHLSGNELPGFLGLDGFINLFLINKIIINY